MLSITPIEVQDSAGLTPRNAAVHLGDVRQGALRHRRPRRIHALLGDRNDGTVTDRFADGGVRVSASSLFTADGRKGFHQDTEQPNQRSTAR